MENIQLRVDQLSRLVDKYSLPVLLAIIDSRLGDSSTNMDDAGQLIYIKHRAITGDFEGAKRMYVKHLVEKSFGADNQSK